MGWGERRGSLLDAAKRAALDERDRLGSPASDYVVGRLTEVYRAVLEGQPIPPAPPYIDLTCHDVDEERRG